MSKDTENESLLRAEREAALIEWMYLDEAWGDFLPTSKNSSPLPKTNDFDNFVKSFDAALDFGCRWAPLLFCLNLYEAYGKRTDTTVELDHDGEVQALVGKEQRRGLPPNRDERTKIKTAFEYMKGLLAEQNEVLLRRARLQPHFSWVRLGAKEAEPEKGVALLTDSLEPEEALLLLRRLLSWAGKFLTLDTENFATVKNAGMLIPVLYCCEVAASSKNRRDKKIAANTVCKRVSTLLLDIQGVHEESKQQNQFSEDNLKIACRRFAKQYPKVYPRLISQLESLHDEATDNRSEWIHIIDEEKQRRRSGALKRR